MPVISLIAAVDLLNGLGKNNQLLCHLPADLKYFKHMTMNKPVLMGYRTWLSIGRPLPQRRNIVLTRREIAIEGVEVVHSLAEGLKLLENEVEIMVIGGAQVFKETLPLATTIYLTLIDHVFDAEVFFPKMEESIWQWEKTGSYRQDENNRYDMTFYKIIRKSD